MATTTRVPNLWQSRNGVYVFKFKLHTKEHKITLQTKNKTEAQIVCLRLRDVLLMMKLNSEMTSDEIIQTLRMVANEHFAQRLALRTSLSITQSSAPTKPRWEDFINQLRINYKSGESIDFNMKDPDEKQAYYEEKARLAAMEAAVTNSASENGALPSATLITSEDEEALETQRALQFPEHTLGSIFKQYSETYCKEMPDDKFGSRKTKRAKRNMAELLVKTFGSERRVQTLKRSALSDWMIANWGSDYEKFTRIKSSIKQMLEIAVRKGFITKNPILDAKPLVSRPKNNIRESKKFTLPFTNSQLREIFNCEVMTGWFNDYPDRFYCIALLYATGARASEIAQLDIQNIKTPEDFYKEIEGELQENVKQEKISSSDRDQTLKKLSGFGKITLTVNPKTKQSLKTPGSFRSIPIHPVFKKLGLYAYLESVSKYTFNPDKSLDPTRVEGYLVKPKVPSDRPEIEKWLKSLKANEKPVFRSFSRKTNAGDAIGKDFNRYIKESKQFSDSSDEKVSSKSAITRLEPNQTIRSLRKTFVEALYYDHNIDEVTVHGLVGHEPPANSPHIKNYMGNRYLNEFMVQKCEALAKWDCPALQNEKLFKLAQEKYGNLL